MTSFFNYVGATAAAVRRPSPAPGAPPWMQRPDWASRVVVDRTSFRTAAFLSAFCVAWCAACVFIFIVNHDRSAAGGGTTWGDIFFAAIFPLSAVAAIAYTIAALRAWHRYGNPVLYIDTLPGYLGDRFRGRRDAAAAGPCRPRSHNRLRAPDLSLGAHGEGRPQKGVDDRNIMVGCSAHRQRPHHAHRRRRQRARRCAAAGRPAGDIADAEEVGIRWCLYLRTAHERKRTTGAVGTIEPESELPPCYAAQFGVPVFAHD